MGTFLAASLFLEASATGKEVRPDELHITDRSLPVCEDSDRPENDVATTPEEAEAQAKEDDTLPECDGSRGGTLSFCLAPRMPMGGRGTNCVEVGEYTGPPRR